MFTQVEEELSKWDDTEEARRMDRWMEVICRLLT